MFSTLVDRCVKQNTSIEVDHGDDMYGRQSVTFITSKDCHIMISMTELTVSCIDIYIRMLYEQLKDYDMLGQFAFINPASVSPADLVWVGRGGRRRASGSSSSSSASSCFRRRFPFELVRIRAPIDSGGGGCLLGGSGWI
ncbi:hypothetical protein LWI28_026797 [Acer negundo]|uniref:Uncharacterized protein n=1 Tax=Acer negundo TaxID=4023 RepID=A0AAD5J2F0_ACENE|nr:hypothetical protein LWI28_026797 [Acer negundo]